MTPSIIGQVLQLQGQRLTRMSDQLTAIETELDRLTHICRQLASQQEELIHQSSNDH